MEKITEEYIMFYEHTYVLMSERLTDFSRFLMYGKTNRFLKGRKLLVELIYNTKCLGYTVIRSLALE